MNSEEYDNLHRVEAQHWFYVGKTEIVLFWLRKLGFLKRETSLADCGAGTGGFAKKAGIHCSVTAVDDHTESLDILRQTLGNDQVKAGSCTELPLDTASFDAVTALDVLEHIEEDRTAVAEMARVLKPGGILIVTVPALQSLWSDWDVSLHHFRRYDAAMLRRTLQHPDLETKTLIYINVFALPMVYVVRAIRRLLGGKHQARLEDAVPPKPINWFLRKAFVLPACQSRIRFPMGVGLLGICRKRSSEA